MPNPPQKFVAERKKTYLDTLREKGTVAAACAAAGVTRETVREHREKFPEFAEAEVNAKQDYRELVIEGEIHRRAVEGWDEPVHYQGAPVSKIRKYSDILLLAHAKRHIPEYRESAVTINDNRTTILQVPDRLAKHLETRRGMLGEVAVQEYKPTKGNGNGSGGNGHE